MTDDALTAAAQVIKQHEGYGCPECTPDGCPANTQAGIAIFDAVAAKTPAGSKTLDEVRALAAEMRALVGLRPMASGTPTGARECPQMIPQGMQSVVLPVDGGGEIEVHVPEWVPVSMQGMQAIWCHCGIVHVGHAPAERQHARYRGVPGEQS